MFNNSVFSLNTLNNKINKSLSVSSIISDSSENNINNNYANEEQLQHILLKTINNKNIFIFKYLLKNGFSITKKINNTIPLYYLIEQNNLYFLNGVINDIDFSNIDYNLLDNNQENIFIKCAKCNNLIFFKKIVQYIIENNHDINIADKLNSKCIKNNSVIYYFLSKNNIYAINYLLDFENINIDIYTQHVPLIHSAIILGNMNIILKLIKYNINILNMKNSKNNISTLQLIVENSHNLLLRIYMKNCIIKKEDLYDNQGNKLLDKALYNNNTLMILDLIELEAIIKIQTYYKKKMKK